MRVAQRSAWWIPVVQVVMVLGILAWLENAVQSGAIAPLYMAAPTQVVSAMRDLIMTSVLLTAFTTTTLEFVAGFATTVVVAIPLGFAIARVPILDGVSRPYVAVAMAIPMVALTPLINIWLGIAFVGKLAFVVLFSFFPVLFNTIAGVSQASIEHVKVGRVLGASHSQMAFKVLLPSAVPSIFAGLRIGAAHGLIGALMGEMLSSEGGLGYVLVKATSTFDMPTSLGIVLVVTLLSLLILKGIDLVERRGFLAWRRA